MLVPSLNTPAAPSMLLVYAITIVLVFLCSTLSGDLVVRHIIPLQQYQRLQQRPIIADVLRDVSETETAATARGSADSNNGAGYEKVPTRGGIQNPRHAMSNNWKEEKEIQRLVWRQRVRALRHADYMRIETLHFLKLIAAAIPRLRNVWRGEDFCAWEGVTCTALHVPLEALIDMPPSMTESDAKGRGGTTSSGKDGLQLLNNGDFDHAVDPVFTIVGLRLRGMNLFGHLPVLRPVGASHQATPHQPAVLVRTLMEKQHTRSQREENRRRLTITSPREPQYWPWDASDMHLHAGLQNSTYEMVRYTLRRILRRLELRGMRNNHSDVQGLGSLLDAASVSNAHGGGSSSGSSGSSSSSSGGGGGGGGGGAPQKPSTRSLAKGAVAGGTNGVDVGMVLHETLLPRMTRQDIAETVFGEIEPRLVAIQRLDISYNPGVLVTLPSEWPFPYMRTFDVAGTSVRRLKIDGAWTGTAMDGMC